jgi:hypothetical protein
LDGRAVPADGDRVGRAECPILPGIQHGMFDDGSGAILISVRMVGCAPSPHNHRRLHDADAPATGGGGARPRRVRGCPLAAMRAVQAGGGLSRREQLVEDIGSFEPVGTLTPL